MGEWTVRSKSGSVSHRLQSWCQCTSMRIHYQLTIVNPSYACIANSHFKPLPGCHYESYVDAFTCTQTLNTDLLLEWRDMSYLLKTRRQLQATKNVLLRLSNC